MGVADGEEVIASGSSGPYWTVTAGPRRMHRVRAVLPRLESDDVLRDALLQERAFPLVAVIHFLRELPARLANASAASGDPVRRSEPAPTALRVHRLRALVAHADTHGYHATMAMIPLDARLPHARRRRHVPRPGRPALAGDTRK